MSGAPDKPGPGEVAAALDFYAGAGEIKWLHAEQWVMTSACGRWQISKQLVGGVPKYSAWKMDPYGLLLGVFDTVDAAKRACASPTPSL